MKNNKGNHQTFSDQLEVLLNEDISVVIERQKAAFDRLAAPFDDKSIVLFGAAHLGKTALAGLRKLGVEPLAFIDNNPALWNQTVDGLEVYSPQEVIQRFGEKAVFVITIFNGCQPIKQLTNCGCRHVIYFAYLFAKYPDIFLPYGYLDLPHNLYKQANLIRKAAILWEDDNSQREYLAQIRNRLFLDFDCVGAPVYITDGVQYFASDLYTHLDDEVFVDCGAYDGDSIRDFIRYSDSFSGKIIAFEPDSSNFIQLQEYVATLPGYIKEKIKLFPMALGSQTGKVLFKSTGAAYSRIADSGDLEVDCISLDTYIGDFLPTFIKMDIEGAELEALAGAKKIIRDTTPILAICVYHRQHHLWEIPLFIQSFSDQYRFFLRSYAEASWDSICYAIPANRLTAQYQNELNA